MNALNSTRRTLALSAALTLLAGTAAVQVAALASSSGGSGSGSSSGGLTGHVIGSPQGVTVGGPTAGGSRHVTVVTKSSDNDHAIEITIDDGKMTVMCDGKQVPEANIKKEDGKIIILDDKGNEINSINMQFAGDGSGVYSLGGGSWSFGSPNGTWTTAAPFMGAADGKEPKVMLGIQMSEPGAALEKHLHIKADESVMVSGIYKGLPADDAGLEQYDIIVKIDGSSPASREAIQKLLQDKDAGDTITLSIIHEGKSKDVKVKLAKYDNEALAKAELFGEAGDNVIWKLSRDSNAQQADLFKRYLVAPNGQGVYSFPDTELRLQGLMRDRKDLNGRLEDVDKRMAQLEKMLQQLIDKQR